MTTTNGTPVEETSVELGDAMNWAADIVNTAINMRAHTRLSGAALRLWDAAIPLFESKNLSIEHRQAIKLCLDALIMQPEVLAWVAREARYHLVKVEAGESRIRVFEMVDAILDREDRAKAETAPLEPVPLAVNHTIDGVICELRPDGALDVSSTPLGLVRMEPREAYALALFMRSPAAVALLEAQNAARQTGSELSYQDDQAEEAVRLAAAR